MTRSTLFAIASLPTLACATADSDGTTAGTQWVVDPTPVVEIGGSDERPDYLLARTAGATRLSDGRIAIADQLQSIVRIYAADGTHEATYGGPGDGPDEFQIIFQIRRMPGDSLVVLHRAGLSWIHPDEGVVRRESFSIWQYGIPCRLAEGGWNVLPNGELFFMMEDNPSPPGCEGDFDVDGLHRQTGLMATVDRATSVWDTFAILPATERNGYNYRVLGSWLTIGIGEDRVYGGDTSSETIEAFDFDGNHVASLPAPFDRRPTPASAKREQVRRWEVDGVEQVGAAYVYPDMLPAYGKLVPGPEHTLWVKAFPSEIDGRLVGYQVEQIFAAYLEPGGSTWRVLDESGEIIAEVDLPERFILLEVGDDYVLGITKDEFDVESVVVHRLSARMTT